MRFQNIIFCAVAVCSILITKVNSQDLTKNPEAWAGTYRGVLPCQGCEGTQTELTLNKNKTFDLITRKIGKGDMGVKAVSGSFSWSKEGNIVQLSGVNREVVPWQYRFNENTLTQLDLAGNAYTENTEKYILKKGEPALEEKYWKLVTLYGNAVVPEKGDRKEAHLMLKAEGNRVAGSGGCNTISGDYQLSEGNGIKFSKVVTTQMSCPVMDTETEFLKILQMVDGYNLKGDTLEIHKAKMVPVAKFVAVYKKN